MFADMLGCPTLAPGSGPTPVMHLATACVAWQLLAGAASGLPRLARASPCTLAASCCLPLSAWLPCVCWHGTSSISAAQGGRPPCALWLGGRGKWRYTQLHPCPGWVATPCAISSNGETSVFVSISRLQVLCLGGTWLGVRHASSAICSAWCCLLFLAQVCLRHGVQSGAVSAQPSSVQWWCRGCREAVHGAPVLFTRCATPALQQQQHSCQGRGPKRHHVHTAALSWVVPGAGEEQAQGLLNGAPGAFPRRAPACTLTGWLAVPGQLPSPAPCMVEDGHWCCCRMVCDLWGWLACR